jgi:hypothetical protein
MKSRKLFACLITIFILAVILIVIILLDRDNLVSLGNTIVITIGGIICVYIGGNVANAWQKSKYYQEALDDGGTNGDQRKG